MDKLYFNEASYWKDEQKRKDRKIFNFLNLHDLYQFHHEPLFKKSLSDKQNINFIDGFVISLFLSLKHMKRVRRMSGPTFTKLFFRDKNFDEAKKHFFIGNLEEKDLDNLSEKFKYLDRKNVFYYNPHYIKDIQFEDKEIKKMAQLINSKKSDCVWVGLGCPKQNILTKDLYEEAKAKYFFNVGAALDFILEKKKEAPGFAKKIGVEWLYRLITDFKHSKKKVWRHFISLKYLFKEVELR